jgi:hypothetical protein
MRRNLGRWGLNTDITLQIGNPRTFPTLTQPRSKAHNSYSLSDQTSLGNTLPIVAPHILAPMRSVSVLHYSPHLRTTDQADFYPLSGSGVGGVAFRAFTLQHSLAHNLRVASVSDPRPHLFG